MASSPPGLLAFLQWATKQSGPASEDLLCSRGPAPSSVPPSGRSTNVRYRPLPRLADGGGMFLNRTATPFIAATVAALFATAAPALADDHGRSRDRDHDGMPDRWEHRHHV